MTAYETAALAVALRRRGLSADWLAAVWSSASDPRWHVVFSAGWVVGCAISAGPDGGAPWQAVCQYGDGCRWRADGGDFAAAAAALAAHVSGAHGCRPGREGRLSG